MLSTLADLLPAERDGQCDHPSATCGGALEVEARDFAASSGELSCGRGHLKVLSQSQHQVSLCQQLQYFDGQLATPPFDVTIG